MDDCSTDNTLENLKALEKPGIKIIALENNRGASAARNIGLQHAKGDWIWFIDPDDYIELNSLKTIQTAIESNPETDSINIEMRYVAEESTPENLIKFSHPNANIGVCCQIIRKDFLQKHNIHFPEGMTYGEDTVFNFLLHINKAKTTFTGKILYNYRQRASSTMHSINHNKHLDNMSTMLNFYQTYLDNNKNKLSENQICHIKRRIQWSAAAVCQDAVRLNRNDALYQIEELKKRNLYPYPILWEKLTLKNGYRKILIESFFLLLPIKFYFNIINRLLNISNIR